MDSKKISIIILVLIAILFVVGQGGALFRNDKKEDKKPTQKRQSEISQEQSGWTGLIRGGLGWLNLIDGIELSRLSTWTGTSPRRESCSGKRVGNHIVLMMDAGCRLSADIKRADADEQELKLKVAEGCEQSREFARVNRLSTVIAAKPHRVPGRIAATPSGEAPAESEVRGWPKLAVTFKPKGEPAVAMENPWICGDKPVTLIILPEGGKLTLNCGGCTDKRRLKIEIE